MRSALLTFMLLACAPEGRRTDGCNDIESKYEQENREETDALRARVIKLEDRLNELDRCLSSKLPYLDDSVFQVRMAVHTCLIVARCDASNARCAQ